MSEARYFGPTCPDCGTDEGKPHRVNCDIEICTGCLGQRFSCTCLGLFPEGCGGHDPEQAIWTGYWPGEISCRRLGWLIGPGRFHEEGSADLNRHAIAVHEAPTSSPLRNWLMEETAAWRAAHP